ncbi:C-terminal helicase domain-containing protein CYBJADRAFT_175945 [Cyberlindnera jadinii NRRL Y-1542]|uniref:Helicase C-terminal domain-containing protein n=1 Tax=Cyberlindnera jadinii (strain ATCC 18201 / CBS 1600 / BCRC 20928 / JCM 3617 / NBRC 0987 / NRRL Y-1542) TaxID=983966 RepID=A0A1E4RTI7_CYBJN|nr:hypothetical protein CYBJADRAFT_175945 [Cyberlindnera jadinii NRRL Y-1542]ODV70582.1 hypothetical protein CYBJADRAFT_175945 [Cyberlindnera jadinii NRRL Y-1542]
MTSLVNRTIQQKEKSLIFFDSKNAMESYRQSLSQFEKGHCCVFHGELPAQEKKTIQDRLRTASDGITLLTTTAASSGLDIDGITSVYLTGFFSLPTLVQIIGRAARKPTETADVKFLFLAQECRNLLQTRLNQYYFNRFQNDENSKVDHIFYKNLFNTADDSAIAPLIDTFMARFASAEELMENLGSLNLKNVQRNLEARVIQNVHDYVDNIPSKRSAPETSENEEPVADTKKKKKIGTDLSDFELNTQKEMDALAREISRDKLVPGFSHLVRWNKFIRNVHPLKEYNGDAYTTELACYHCHSQNHGGDDEECPIKQTVKNMVEVILILRDVHGYDRFCDSMVQHIEDGLGLRKTMNFLGRNMAVDTSVELFNEVSAVPSGVAVELDFIFTGDLL